MFKRIFIIFALFVAFAYAKYDREYRAPSSVGQDIIYDASFKM